ncbi:hypothetical protein [Subtercola boreus]|uniref:hypothetical protein n=1 Tax=Subtercola boreus TaxID=120213 RepID=UPI0011C02F18|nr:hypothetical protein [Subtercola boreus]
MTAHHHFYLPWHENGSNEAVGVALARQLTHENAGAEVVTLLHPNELSNAPTTPTDPARYVVGIEGPGCSLIAWAARFGALNIDTGEVEHARAETEWHS